MGSEVIRDSIKKSKIKNSDINEIIMGQVLTGAAGQNPARQAAIKCGIPKETPAFIVNQVCGSGIRSIASGFQSIKGGQTVGGYAPQFSASIYNGKLSIEGTHVIDEKNLKGKWHKVEFNIRYSKDYDGFIKVYINDELKVNRSGFKTASHDYVDIKYGSYSHPEYGGANYPEGYQFPSHTIYFAGFSMNKDRSKLIISKN